MSNKRKAGPGSYQKKVITSDGEVLHGQGTGPRKLFPDIEEDKLPSIKDFGEDHQRLRKIKRELEEFWRTSPYYIKLESSDIKENPHSDKFALYTDPFYHTIFSKPRIPLSSVMLLNPVHFPSEILPKAAIEAAKASGYMNGTSVSQSQVWKIRKSTSVDSNAVKELEKYQELENRDASDNEQNHAKDGMGYDKDEDEKKKTDQDDEVEVIDEFEDEDDYVEDDYNYIEEVDDDDLGLPSDNDADEGPLY